MSYHVARLPAEARAASADELVLPEPASSSVPTRGPVAELLAAGFTRAAVARALGISKATVSYHARRLDESIDER